MEGGRPLGSLYTCSFSFYSYVLIFGHPLQFLHFCNSLNLTLQLCSECNFFSPHCGCHNQQPPPSHRHINASALTLPTFGLSIQIPSFPSSKPPKPVFLTVWPSGNLQQNFLWSFLQMQIWGPHSLLTTSDFGGCKAQESAFSHTSKQLVHTLKLRTN